ncbi:MAG: hypothetical protein WC695_08830 [Candidatus Omnitrophota bacterium]
MYTYDHKPQLKGINSREIFVVMPFSAKYDGVYENLINPAIVKANDILCYSDKRALYAHRTKEDIRMTSGWINVLDHLMTAQIVLGVLTTETNPNVFYELGIAHATQPKERQILIAEKGYNPTFDTKDLIFYEYENDLTKSIEPLANRIVDAIKSYEIENEKRIKQARMLLGPYEFEVIMTQCGKRNFAFHTSPQGRKDYEDELISRLKENHLRGAFERHVPAIANLCTHGILGLNTASTRAPTAGGEKTVVEFSYWWTDLGNSLLYLMKLITKEELQARRDSLPDFFQ